MQPNGNWKQTVGRWMLQICTMDIWCECQCGYFYFYDMMTLMEGTLMTNRPSPDPSELYSLAAACLIASYKRSYPGEKGELTLLHLLVHRLQRCPIDIVVTRSSILKELDNVYPLLCELDCHDILEGHEPRPAQLLFLDMMDLIEGQPNVPRPTMQGVHLDCTSHYFSLVDESLESPLFHATSADTVSRVTGGSLTAADRHIYLEAGILQKRDTETVDDLVRQAIAFRWMAPYIPPVKCLTRQKLVFIVPPEQFWNDQTPSNQTCTPWAWMPIYV